MDPIICCLMGLCCPPFSPEQREAFEAQIVLHFDGDKDKAKKVCDEIYGDFAKATEKLLKAVRKADKA